MSIDQHYRRCVDVCIFLPTAFDVFDFDVYFIFEYIVIILLNIIIVLEF